MVLDFLRRVLEGARRTDPLEGVGDEPGRLRLIVGLGNPGEAYASTRHNVGFLCLDEIARRIDARWRRDLERTQSLVAVGQLNGFPLALAKPQTFMNNSGQAVVALLDALRIEPTQVLVVYDDMDLSLGAVRMRPRGSAGTHNGMRSVLQMAGTEEITRLRIGIGQSGARDARDYVLDTFGDDERDTVAEVLGHAASSAMKWAVDGPAAAMNAFNR